MPPVKASAAEVAALRGLLARSGGRPSWQALEQVAGSPEFQAFLQARHPSLDPLLAAPGRRRLLQIMAASFAFGGLTGGARAQSSGYGEIIPYVNQPTGLTPTMPLSYASATLLDGIANGVLVTTIDGRPIKIEGNADHPWSRGGTDVFGQASVLGLYDPDRSQAVTHLGDVSDWDSFHTAMLGRFGELRAAHGKGARLLTGSVTSPTLIAQIQRHEKHTAGDALARACTRRTRRCLCRRERGIRQAAGDPLELRQGRADRIAGRRFSRIPGRNRSAPPVPGWMRGADPCKAANC